MKSKRQGIGVEGLVARRDKRPYILLTKDGETIAQISMVQARNIAHDILTMCARTEADAIIHRFFESKQVNEIMAAEIMFDFRNFRFDLDSEKLDTFVSTPSFDPKPQ